MRIISKRVGDDRRIQGGKGSRIQVTRSDIIEKALSLGFGDVGFTTAEPFDSHRECLRDRQEEYGWAESVGLALMAGVDPKSVLPTAKSIIVLLDEYFREAFPGVAGKQLRPLLS